MVLGKDMDLVIFGLNHLTSAAKCTLFSAEVRQMNNELNSYVFISCFLFMFITSCDTLSSYWIALNFMTVTKNVTFCQNQMKSHKIKNSTVIVVDTFYSHPKCGVMPLVWLKKKKRTMERNMKGETGEWEIKQGCKSVWWVHNPTKPHNKQATERLSLHVLLCVCVVCVRADTLS